jgi:hypothetical protein
MSCLLKLPCFKKFRSIVLEENRSQKHYRRTLGLVKNIIPSATSLHGAYEFQHTSNLTNLNLTTLFSSPGCSQRDILPSLCVRRPSVRPSVRRKLFIQRSSPLKLLGQLKPNLVTMVLRWSPFKIVSGRSGSNPRFTD